MNKMLLKAYHHSPYSLRMLAASARGYYLQFWRYGPETDELVAACLERDYWDADRLRDWQQEQLARILHRAATRVPFYREQWAARRSQGDRASWEVLENWPVLKKDTLRARSRDFVADDRDVRKMLHEHTSGTSGKPVSHWWGRVTARASYALFEARVRIWNGISRDDRWAILGGQLVTPFEQSRPPFWVWNAGMRQLYLSSYHLTPDNIPVYLEALRSHNIQYVLGYASSLYTLAQTILERDLTAPALQVAISNAEPLFDYQRAAIEQAFRCTMRNTYGMSENVCGASECAAATMHLWPEMGVLEVLDDTHDRPLAEGEMGRFICTGLLNTDMPFIRYEIGDRGALAMHNAGCQCGRTLPAIQAIEGRMDDVIITPDGRRVGRLDPVFKADMPIHEAQIIQKTIDHITVRFVPASNYTTKDGELIISRLCDRVGAIHIDLEMVDTIPREANGKFRAVISHVAIDDMQPVN
jgi:phenylacetate-CoA ligase